MSLEHGLPGRAAATPDAPALETPAGTLSFARLADLAARGATYLDRIDPSDDAPVALLLDGDADFAVWFHAAMLAGRRVLPLNLRLTVNELAQQLEHAKARCLLGAAEDPRLAALASRLPLLRAEQPPRPSSLPQSPAVRVLPYTDFILSRQAMQCAHNTMEFYRYTTGAFLTWAEGQNVTTPEPGGCAPCSLLSSGLVITGKI